MTTEAKKLWQECLEILNPMYPIGEANAIFFLLMEDSWGIKKSKILSNGLVSIDQQRWIVQLERLGKGEPVQYVIGSVLFDGLRFSVNSNVLIPRPETEEMVKMIKTENKEIGHILDIGCGSGCIGIALAKFFGASLTGIDVSSEAIRISAQNAADNQVFAEFHEQNVLIESILHKKFDLIVSNPPYIPWSEKAEMSKNVVDYEPHDALFVPDNDPVVFYRRIASIGPDILNANGKIYLEIHEDYAQSTLECFEKDVFTSLQVINDFNQKPRILRVIS